MKLMKKQISILLLIITLITTFGNYINVEAMYALANPEEYQENFDEENPFINDPITGIKYRPMFGVFRKYSLVYNFNLFSKLQQKSENAPKSSITSKLASKFGYLTNYEFKELLIEKNKESNGKNNERYFASALVTGTGLNKFFDKWTNSYVIPGMVSCANGCEDMIPQGLCIAENYLLITLYCPDKKHDSVIIVMDKSNGLYIKTVILEGIRDENNKPPHVGGITYCNDGKEAYVFVTGFPKTDNRKTNILRFEFVDILNANDGDSIPAVTKTFVPIAVETPAASFVSYNKFNNRIYVGYFTEIGLEMNSMYIFKFIDGSAKINNDDSYLQYGIHNLMQGIDFLNEDKALIVRSGGILNSSLNLFYVDSKGLLSKIKTQLICPPYMEEIAVDYENKKLFCIFESGADSYNGNVTIPIDRIVILDIEDWL